MKILHICLSSPYNDYYGYQDNLLPLYHKKLGNEVTVITTIFFQGKNGLEETNEGAYTLDNGLNIIRYKAKGKFKKYKQMLGLYNIYNKICELHPNFIMIHGIGSFSPIPAIKYIKKNNSKCILIGDNHLDEVNHFRPKKFKYYLFELTLKLLNKYWLKYYYKIYGVTPWRTEYAHQIFGIPYSKLDTLVMGADDDKIDFTNSDKIRREIRVNNNIRKDDFLFITGGKIDENKKTLESILAFKNIKDEKCKFLIFGNVSTTIKDKFNTLIRNDERIIYVGHLPSDKVYDYFLASDFGVFAGGHSVLWEQAIGTGLPCIFRAYKQQSYPDIGGNCILLNEITEQTIYSVLQKIISDYEFYNKMKSIAKIKGVKEFSYREIAKKSLISN